MLNRLAFGPKPGDVERGALTGVQRYIDAQLQPHSLAYPAALTERLASLDAANASAGQFAELQKQVRDGDEGARQVRRARLAAIAPETAEARAIDSPRQLEEVMVDFWYNHFNVFAGKGIDRALVASYERDAIRPSPTAARRCRRVWRRWRSASGRCSTTPPSSSCPSSATRRARTATAAPITATAT